MGLRDEPYQRDTAERATDREPLRWRTRRAPGSGFFKWKQGTFPHVSHLVYDKARISNIFQACLPARAWIGEIRSTVAPVDRKNK